VFRAEAHTNKPRGNAAKHREASQHPQRQRHRKLLASGKDAADNAILNENLQALRQPCRQFAPALHPVEIIHRDSMLAQRSGQNVGRRDGILNGQIDADAADRRHGVRRIADTQ
jgi:hypothetical protein